MGSGVSQTPNIDQNGKEVIPCRYSTAGDFLNGIAVVDKNGKRGCINKKGEEIVKPKYNQIDAHFEDGYAWVTDKNGKIGMIDQAGKEIIKPKYTWTVNFSEGLAAVSRGNKMGYVNMEGKEVIKPQYDQANGFSEGLAAVCKGGKWCLIDKNGNVAAK